MAILTQQQKLQSYYKWHAHLYDASRWSFLFGRSSIIQSCADIKPDLTQIMEVGCGTGNNMKTIACTFPNSQITACDLSEAMLEKAARKCAPLSASTHLVSGDYLDLPQPTHPYELVLFSYILTMIPDEFEEIIKKAQAELHPKGLIAIVDFHSSTSRIFTQWMKKNHVRLNHGWEESLVQKFKPKLSTKKIAYAGLWTYFQFIGQKL